MVGGLSGMTLNAQVRSSPAPRKVALPVAVMAKRCSSVPAGAFTVSFAGVTPPRPETLRLTLPVERTTSVELTRTATMPLVCNAVVRQCRRLAEMDAGQDQRRLAGIDRRNDPGIDAEIRRQYDTVPVERC